ncbi:MAG TPA: hypothetical protein VMS98_19220 [Thermoanaerobaculia bacterium]|nr:hypothetical protein [Thermoanaerobaculia bacterium]
MSRDALRQIVAGAATLALCIALLHRYYVRRGPYFEKPRTIVEHVDIIDHEARDVILLAREVAPLIPPGAQVTCFEPVDGKHQYDGINYLSAVGLLPNHQVLPPFAAGEDLSAAEVVEYVIAVREPFDHPAYSVVAGFPTGYLYKARR